MAFTQNYLQAHSRRGAGDSTQGYIKINRAN